MSFFRHLYYIFLSLIFFLIVPGIVIYSVIKGNSDVPYLGMFIYWHIFGIFFIPGFILHSSYYVNDRNKTIKIDEFENITISNDYEIVTIKKPYIETITNHHSGIHNSTTWNGYNYSVIKLKNGQKYIITCLIIGIDELDKRLSGRILIRKNHFISTLNYQ